MGPEETNKKSSMPMIIGVIVVLALIAGGSYAFTRDGGYGERMMEDGASMYEDGDMESDAAMEKDGDAMMEEDDDAMMKADVSADVEAEGSMMTE